MIDIWTEPSNFNYSSTFFYQSWVILKKRLFSHFEILYIFEEVNNEEYRQDPTTQNKKLNLEKQEPTKRSETQNKENESIHTKQMLIEEFRIYIVC